jgi:hypothetical protein
LFACPTIIIEKTEKLRQKKMAQLRKDNLALFFLIVMDTNSIATTKKVTAIVAGNSGIVGEGSRLVGEDVGVRLVGEAVAVEVKSTTAVYSVVAAY